MTDDLQDLVRQLHRRPHVAGLRHRRRRPGAGRHTTTSAASSSSRSPPTAPRTALTDLPSRCTGRYLPGAARWSSSTTPAATSSASSPCSTSRRRPAAPAGLDDLDAAGPRPGAHAHVLTTSPPPRSSTPPTGATTSTWTSSCATWTRARRRVVFDDGGYVVRDVGLARRVARSRSPRSACCRNCTTVSLAGPRGAGALTDPDEHANHHGRRLGRRRRRRSCVASNHDREFTRRLARSASTAPGGLLVEDDEHDLACWVSPDGSRHGRRPPRRRRSTSLAVHEADGTHRVDVDLTPSARRRCAGRPTASAFAGDRDDARPTRARSSASTPPPARSTQLVDGRAALPADAARPARRRPTVHRVPTPDGEQVPVLRSTPAPGRGRRRSPAPRWCIVHGGPEAEATRMFSARRRSRWPLAGFDGAGAQRARLGRLRQALGLPRRRRAPARLGRRPRRHPRLAARRSGSTRRARALWGGSYGGYMVLAGRRDAAGRCGRPASTSSGSRSLVTFLENTSAYRRAYREREYGFLDRDRDFLVKASPITYLDDIGAPLFVIHGANDPRVPLSEAEQIKAALDGKGVALRAAGVRTTRVTASPSGPTGSTPTPPRSPSSPRLAGPRTRS